MHPKTASNPNIHRGPVQSEDFNAIQQSIRGDLERLFHIASDHDETIERHMDLLLRSNYFLQNKIHVLEGIVEEMEANHKYREQSRAIRRLIRTFYSKENLISAADEGEEATVNTQYGFLTLDHSDITPKLSFPSEEGETIVPSSFQADIYEATNASPVNEATGDRDYYLLETNGTDAMVDQDDHTYWVQSSRFPTSANVSEVYAIVHLQVPMEAINNIHANTLRLAPYPLHSMQVDDIQYKAYSGQWRRLPTFPVDGNDEPIPQTDAAPLFFAFDDLEVTELKVHLTQPYWFAHDDRRDFAYGFQDICLEYRNYDQSRAEIITPFTLSDTTKQFSSVYRPHTQLAAGTPQDVEDLVEHRLYYDEDLENEFPFGSAILAPVQTVYIRTILTSANQCVPFLSQVALDYTSTEMG